MVLWPIRARVLFELFYNKPSQARTHRRVLLQGRNKEKGRWSDLIVYTSSPSFSESDVLSNEHWVVYALWILRIGPFLPPNYKVCMLLTQNKKQQKKAINPKWGEGEV